VAVDVCECDDVVWNSAPGNCILNTMTSFTGNIEAVARDICAKQLARHGASGATLAADVDRFWHCVAAEIEAGRVDDDGKLIPASDHDEGLRAYRDWCQRHPESRPN
jgi:hypothetical protein